MNAGTWATIIIAGISAVAGIGSAIAAWVQAIRSRKAARGAEEAAADAKDALAYALRPVLHGQMSHGHTLTDADREGKATVSVSNLAAFDATDVVVHAQTDVGREVEVKNKTLPRLNGQIPNTLGGDGWQVDLEGLPPLREEGDEQVFTLIMRANDDRPTGAQRWEQQVTIKRWAMPYSDGAPLSAFAEHKHGMPRKIASN